VEEKYGIGLCVRTMAGLIEEEMLSQTRALVLTRMKEGLLPLWVIKATGRIYVPTLASAFP
jgi:hypothetical protein